MTDAISTSVSIYFLSCPSHYPHSNFRVHQPLFTNPTKQYTMLRYAFIFFVLALIAGILGFGITAAGAASIAKFLFVVFVILFLVSGISRALQGKKYKRIEI